MFVYQIRELGYMRSAPVDEQNSTRILRDRIAAEHTPEVVFCFPHSAGVSPMKKQLLLRCDRISSFH